MKDRLQRLVAFDRQYIKSITSGCVHPIHGGTQLTLFSQPLSGVIGVDEVGRGCLAGPVMAGAVMLPLLESDTEIAERLSKLNDSKQLSASCREDLARTIRACSWYAIGSASAEEIDCINILQACHLAMRRAVEALIESIPDDIGSPVVLVDGKYPIHGLDLEQQVAIPKGDTVSASIAAASVIAKVERDHQMRGLARDFPEFSWDKNKGYPSVEHREALHRLGRTEWHRRSFFSTTDKQLRLEFSEESVPGQV